MTNDHPATPGPGTSPDSDRLHCIQVVELVTDYLEGALVPEEVARLEQHLEVCDPCVRYIEQVRETIRAAGSVEAEPVPAEVMSRLLSAYRELRGA